MRTGPEPKGLQVDVGDDDAFEDDVEADEDGDDDADTKYCVVRWR